MTWMPVREPAAALHVEPRPGGRWVVRREAETAPVSEHRDAHAATRAAVERADSEGQVRVFVHDLYSCVRPVAAAGAGRTRGSRGGC